MSLISPHYPLGGPMGAHSLHLAVTNAPIRPESEQMVAHLRSHDLAPERYDGVAATNAFKYTTPVYTVGPDCPTYRVQWRNLRKWSWQPKEFYDPAYGAHFVDVPIPEEAAPAEGSDAQLTIYQPDTDRVWELWKANRTVAEDGTVSWGAEWGGRLDSVSSSPGYFPNGMGSSATGILTSAASVGVLEALNGRIEHAVSLCLYAPKKNSHSYPAQRNDGWCTDEFAIEEGARLRLRADASLERCTPFAQMVGEAAKTFGFVVTDKAGCVSVNCEDGRGYRDATGVDPWKVILGSTPAYAAMKYFPWSKIEVVERDYGRRR